MQQNLWQEVQLKDLSVVIIKTNVKPICAIVKEIIYYAIQNALSGPC